MDVIHSHSPYILYTPRSRCRYPIWTTSLLGPGAGCPYWVGDAGPGCLPLARDLLLDECVPSCCGIGGSVAVMVLCGVCSVVPVGGGWGGVVQGPCLAVSWSDILDFALWVLMMVYFVI
ncbi:hypothetical protein AMECASPLE_034576 [Ameca splendens]|uniref:Uncharacterized protein n=1 Tax=Ameca splendens TaxID=208324 RepID=A0ABV0XVZ9_9TELE